MTGATEIKNYKKKSNMIGDKGVAKLLFFRETSKSEGEKVGVLRQKFGEMRFIP